jgi:NAD dependent epimerase/dehydratase family enzyme
MLSDIVVVLFESASLNDEIDNENIDAVVNLSGENIFGRWTKKKKKGFLIVE